MNKLVFVKRVFYIIIPLFVLFINCNKNESNINKVDSSNVVVTDSSSLADSLPFSQYDSCLWVSFSDRLNKDIFGYNGTNVIIKGIFNYGDERGYGHFSKWKGEISNISAIRKLPENKIKSSYYLNVLDLLKNSEKYNGKIVSVKGFLSIGIEYFSIKPVKE